MVDFESTNWFDQYLAHRREHPLRTAPELSDQLGIGQGEWQRFVSARHPLYGLLQQSGTIYGFPIEYPFQEPEFLPADPRLRAKLILIDLIFYSLQVKWEEKGSMEPTDYARLVDRAGKRLKTYFSGLLRQKESEEEASIEQLLFERVAVRRNIFDYSKTGINSHLFWDWYFCVQFMERDENEVPDADFFSKWRERKKELKVLTIKLLSAAVHSDKRLKRPERVLQNHFRRSIRSMSPLERARLDRMIRGGVMLHQIYIPPLSWIARRYLLDVCLMALYVDNKLQPEEADFLESLRERLDLQPEDVSESKLALGCFLVQYARDLHFFNSRKVSLSLIGDAIAENIQNIHKATRMEYRETIEMANVFGQVLRHQLRMGKEPRLPSEEEIAQAIDQLKDIPKFLPFFTFIFMPVPGITEAYILLAYSIEKMTGNTLRLLPTHFSRMVKRK